MRRAVLAASGAAALACSGLGGPDMQALTQIADAVETLDVSDRGRVLLIGLVDPGVGVVGDACAAKVREGLTAPDPSAKAMAYADAITGLCPATCAQDVLADLATMDPASRAAAVLAACDAKGPDAAFGRADLAAIRPEIDGADYLVARMLLEPALAATAGTDLGARYELLAMDTALSLAVQAPPRVTAEQSEVRSTTNVAPDEVTTLSVLMGCRDGVARLVTDAQGAVVAATGSGTDGACIASALAPVRFPATSDGGHAVIDVGWSGPPEGGMLGLLVGRDLSGIFGVIGEPGVEGFGGLGSLRDGTDGGVIPVEPERASPSVSTAPVEVEGGLSKEIVSRTMKRYVVQVRYCYEKLLTENPHAAGKLDLELTIGSDGTVTRSRANSDLGTTLTECVAEKAAKWEFPAPEGGGTVQVKYPFTFSPS